MEAPLRLPAVPEPTPPVPVARVTMTARVVMAAAVAIGFSVLQGIVLVAAAGVARVTGLATVDISQLATRADTVPVLLVLAAADVATAAIIVLGVWARTQSFAALALKRRGAARSFAYALPLLVPAVGLPAFAAVAGHHHLVARDVHATLAATIVLLAIAVAVVEELVFRGVLMSLLGVDEHPWFAISVSAIVFTALHAAGPGSSQSVVSNMLQVAGIVAVPFACIRMVAGSIGGLIIAHALIDGTSLLQLGGYHLPAPPSRGEAIAQGVLSFVIALGYLAWAYVRVRRARRAQALSGMDIVS